MCGSSRRRWRGCLAGGAAGLALAAVTAPVATARIELVSVGAAGPADAGGEQVSLSRDGRFVAFRSAATNLSPAAVEPGREQQTDVFVRDRLSGATVLATRPGPSGNAVDPTISADGRRVAFVSAPVPLEPGALYVADVASGRSTFVSHGLRGYGHGWSRAPSKLSAEGRFVVYVCRRGAREDLYVHDLARHRSTRVAAGPARRSARRPVDLRRRPLRRLVERTAGRRRGRRDHLSL